MSPFFNLVTSHFKLSFSHFHFLFMLVDYILMYHMSVSTSCICLLSAHLCSSSYQPRCKSVPPSLFIGSSAPTALMFFFCSPVLMCPLCLWFVPRGFIVCPPLFSLLPFWCLRIGFRDFSFVTKLPFMFFYLPASVCLALGSLFDHT